MDQPKIPTLKDSQKPQVKIKGLAAGLSLFDRLKQFKKKDLAFILAGLGTLFMAPLAEHFMMAPENGDGTMTQGWGGKGGSNLFGSGASPYESGITGLAPGGAIGGGGDVITPLNVRDPSALVMGPGSQQQPPAGSMAPTAPPPSSKEPDLKDALANAAARAAGAATRRAPVPVPKPGMTGSGLRGLGVVSGGSSAGAGLAPINSNGLAPRGAAGSNSLGDVRPTSNYRGVAGARGPGKGSNIEALKGAAGGAGGLFNQGGGAGNALEAAASQAIPNGNAFGGGNGGPGGNDKGPGGNNSPGSKSVGESLEFLRQKSEMEKAIDLKWKMKEKKAMFPLELGQEAAKTAVMKGVVEPLSGMFGDWMKSGFGSGDRKLVQCRTTGGGWTDYPQACKDGTIFRAGRSADGKCSGEQINKAGTDCREVTMPGAPSDGATPNPEERGGQTGAQPPVATETTAAAGKLSATCGAMTFGDLTGATLKNAEFLKSQSGAVLTAYNSVIGGSKGCGASAVDSASSAVGQHKAAVDFMETALTSLGAQVSKAEGYKTPPEVAKAAAALEAAKVKMDAAEKALTTALTGGEPSETTTPDVYFKAPRTWSYSEPRRWNDEAVAAYNPAKKELEARKKAHDVLKEAQAGLELAANEGGTTQKAVALAKAQLAVQTGLEKIESAGEGEAKVKAAVEAKAEVAKVVAMPLPKLEKYTSADFTSKATAVNGTAGTASTAVGAAADAVKAAKDAHKAWVDAGSKPDARQPVTDLITAADTKVKAMQRAVGGGEAVAQNGATAAQPAVSGVLKDEQTYRGEVDTKRKSLVPPSGPK